MSQTLSPPTSLLSLQSLQNKKSNLGLMLLPTPWRSIKPTQWPAHYQMEEGTYNSGALALEDVVAWAASLDPAPEGIHIDLRSPSRNSYLGGKA